MIRVIITGSTGMVGEGVLYECLKSDQVEAVLVINRKPCGYSHPKLSEIIHNNFYNLKPIESELKGYNACYFCLGVTSVGKNEEEYTRLTYDLTLHVCELISQNNTDLTICYISGAGTYSDEKGKLMWARVKGKTENDIMRLKEVKGFAFRPGIIKPIKGLKFTHQAYKYFLWVFPIIKLFGSNVFCSLEQIGKAMIQVSISGRKDPRLEVKDIIEEAAKYDAAYNEVI